MIDDPKRRPQGFDHRPYDISEVSERAFRREALIAARVHQLEVRGWKNQDYQRALAWHAALSASLGRTTYMPKELSAVVKLLWEQHVLGEPNQSQIGAFYAVIKNGDRFIIIQTSRGIRRTVARLGGFLFQDVRKVLEEDDEAVFPTTHIWVYAPIPGA